MRFPGRKESRLLNCRNKKTTETLYYGAEYTRDMIEREVKRLQRIFPNKEFQVAILYDKAMSGQPFGSADPVLLYSLLDTYDESQIPDIEHADPEIYDMFWV